MQTKETQLKVYLKKNINPIIVQGPPGSGSHMIATAIALLLLCREVTRILVLAPTNHALDSLYNSVYSKLDSYGDLIKYRLIRLGVDDSKSLEYYGSHIIFSNALSPFLIILFGAFIHVCTKFGLPSWRTTGLIGKSSGYLI